MNTLYIQTRGSIRSASQKFSFTARRQYSHFSDDAIHDKHCIYRLNRRRHSQQNTAYYRLNQRFPFNIYYGICNGFSFPDWIEPQETRREISHSVPMNSPSYRYTFSTFHLIKQTSNQGALCRGAPKCFTF